MRVGFELRPLDGQLRTVDIPWEGASPAAAEDLFEQACRAIAEELHVRRRAGAEWQDWVHLAAYEFLSRIISYGHAGLFEERIARLERDRKGSSHVNPFQRGLLAIFAHEKGLMDERERYRVGKRLWYAYRHYVPPCFLMGFLYQVWSRDAERKVAAGAIESEFEQWIWFERAADPRPEIRGRYPPDLEEKVALVRKLAPIVNEAAQARERFQIKRRQTEGAGS